MQEIATNGSGEGFRLKTGRFRVLYAETTRDRVPGEDTPLCRVGYWLETPSRFRFLGERRESAENWIQTLTR